MTPKTHSCLRPAIADYRHVQHQITDSIMHKFSGLAHQGAKINIGAEYTIEIAGSLSDNEVFSRPELPVMGIPIAHGFGRDGANRKAARMAISMYSTSRHQLHRLNNGALVSESQIGAKTMPTGNTTTTPKQAKSTTSTVRRKASKAAIGTIQKPSLDLVPDGPANTTTRRILPPDVMRIREALCLAIWHIDNGQNLHATGWASSAARRLQRMSEAQLEGGND